MAFLTLLDFKDLLLIFDNLDGGAGCEYTIYDASKLLFATQAKSQAVSLKGLQRHILTPSGVGRGTILTWYSTYIRHARPMRWK